MKPTALYPLTLSPLMGVGVQITPKEERVPEHWVADEGWRFVDGQGHGHFYDEGFDTHYPTLVREHRDCDVHDDCEGEVYWVCKLCGEVVGPGARLVPDRFEVIGHDITLTWHSPDGDYTYKLSEEEYDEVLRAASAAAAAAFREAMAEHTPDAVELRLDGS